MFFVFVAISLIIAVSAEYMFRKYPQEIHDALINIEIAKNDAMVMMNDYRH